MPKTVINDSEGLKQTTGGGLEISTTSTFSSSPTMSVNSLTSNTTLAVGGVYTVSGNSAVTTVMPLASEVPGATFIFRSTSAHAHVLTGSQETSGTKVFAGMFGVTGVSGQGSSLALNSTLGSSVALVSDGKSFLLHALSGSCTISGN